MPVRKIPKNYLCVTGNFASTKNRCLVGFESLLEKDYMIHLEFDHSVERFEGQPVRIPVSRKRGAKTYYVPDLLIHYHQGTRRKKPVLAEIKSRKDLEKNKEKYAPKFLAAKKYAADQGWQFQVVDDKQIRTTRLQNLKFLREYHLIQPDVEGVHRVLGTVKDAGNWITLDDLLSSLCREDNDRLVTLPVIWHLIAKGRIMADMDKPFSVSTALSLPHHGRRQA